MAYDEDLAARLREALADEPELTEKKMFGGLGFVLHGNTAIGVSGDALMVRQPKGNDAVLAEPGVRPFVRGGRAMNGWLLVEPPGHENTEDLRRWVDRAMAQVRTLPPK